MHQEPSLWLKDRPKHTLWLWLSFGLVVISVYSALIGAFLGVFGIINITRSLFLIILSVQAVIVGFFGFIIYLYREYLTAIVRAIASNIVVMVVWWGLLQTLLTFFVVNLNPVQEQTIINLLMWGMPIAILIIGVCAFFIARPLRRSKDSQALHRYTLRFSKIFAYSTTSFITLSYLIGIFWLASSTGLPIVEFGKLAVLGAMGAFVTGAFLLSVGESLAQSTRRDIASQYRVADKSRKILAQRMLGMSLVVSLGVMLFLGTVVLQSYQQITIENTQRLVDQVIKQFVSSQVINSQNEDRRTGGQLSVSPGTEVIGLSAGQQLAGPNLSDDVVHYVSSTDNGVIVNYYKTIKIVRFFVDPLTREKIVVIVPLGDFHEPVVVQMQRYVVVTTIGIIVLMIAVVFSVSYLSSQLQALSQAVRRARDTQEPFVFNTYSADELEELSLAFNYYINKSKELHSGLEDKVKQRTDTLLKAEEEVRRAEMAVVRQNAELEQQKRHIAEESADELEKVVDERTSALQEALEHLQELDQVKTEFISLASHQLRTPLTSLRWAQHALLEGSAGKLNEEQQEIISTTLERILYMMTLVNELLDVTRIEDQNYELKVSKVDMHALLTRITGEFKDVAALKKVSFDAKVPESLPEAMVDDDKVGMAVANMLDNAIKYTNSGGLVTLQASKDQNSIRVQVTDTGIGISEKDQYRIFSKFFRAGNAMSMHTVGSGLGMYITKTIAEKHGGTVELESEEGKGTTFILTIPLERTQENEEQQLATKELKKVKELGAITSLIRDKDSKDK